MDSKLIVDPSHRISKIDPRMWGSFIEHLGRVVYGGIYQPGHPKSDENGFRLDVIEAIKKLNVPLIRYPGGNFVSGYNWEDGIGPKNDRPVRADFGWQSIETNQFGLHEFIEWSRKVGAEPDMAVNLGTRGIDAARNLVEYCNFEQHTYLSDLRRKNGAEEPFNIKLWSLGNEMDGDWQIGHKTASEYGRLAHETAKAMRKLDPSIELIATGSSLHDMPTFGTWEETVLDNCFEDVDYLSLHQYYGNEDNNLSEFLGKSEDFNNFINDVIAICDAVKARKHSSKQINLSFDEWNVWYHSKENDDKQELWQKSPQLLEDHYNYEDALLIGSLAITLMKYADRVKIAALAQLVNVIAPIMTDPVSGNVWLQSIFYPFMQVSNFGQGVALTPNTEVESYKCKDYEVPYSDSIAVYNEQRDEVVIFVENKSKQSMHFKVDIKNIHISKIVEATEFAGYDIKQTNEDGKMKLNTLSKIYISDAGIDAELKPLSWNMIRVVVD
ncbi:alpha-N-arabinofuranosidase [Lentilactobacillus sp. Marseille-Q4993]|uniref:arabinosylfuranosidase ArfA n=1 Tax=Lentilactobacillus sp. Marseille-Q4993 TaxID=3039492 RepID=UPI0024BC253D|nr:alpha-N-arabinofuranosidase [Lentilactobacillus sp. Marseille-Q4993]